MKISGVDTLIGKIASTIMGSTETTLYTIAIYTSVVKVKKIRFVLVCALLADIVRNGFFYCFLSNFVVEFSLTFFLYGIIIVFVINFVILERLLIL